MVSHAKKVVEPVPETEVMTPQEQDIALAKSMQKSSSSKPNWFLIAIVAAVLLGLGTGYVSAALSKSPQLMATTDTGADGAGSAADVIKVGQVFGSKDAGAFKDSAEGIILPGGIDSEGSHHLVRSGGPSQNVYLTSSVVDLKLFENAKVKIYGETFKGRKAGWLMDVGRVEVQELNAPLPDWVVKEQAKTKATPVAE